MAKRMKSINLAKDKSFLVAWLIVLVGVGFFIGANFEKIKLAVESAKNGKAASVNPAETKELEAISKQVLPEEGFTLPISWGDLGPRMVKLGVIDLEKFKEAVTLTPEQLAILTSNSSEKIKIDHTSGQFVVDVLWALGLAQKSIVYDKGPLGTEYKDEQGNFASTGGWTLAKGDALNYLNKSDLIDLDGGEQKRVWEISNNVYRPCCGNPTSFPDCNHGMAALAAIELLVDAGLTDEEVYKEVLKLNSFWFPDTYLTTAAYFKNKGISWDKVDAKEVLGEGFSSAQGASKIAKEVGPLPDTFVGGSCGA